MSDPVPETEFTRNFGSYLAQAQLEPVPVSSQGKIAGYFISPEDYEEFERLRKGQSWPVDPDLGEGSIWTPVSAADRFNAKREYWRGMMPDELKPRLVVIGVGNGGVNAVNTMIALNLPGVEFVVANTDAQQLMHSRAERRVQLGPHITQGSGAGGKPEVGRAAAEEAIEDLACHMDGAHMVFIVAGMGGGTGTGAAPVIARMARERNILTVGVVTKPFAFEDSHRMHAAEEGINTLQSFVDTLIVIPNESLLRPEGSGYTRWEKPFELADRALCTSVRGVTDLMMVPGLVNIDYADIRSVMAGMGKGIIGIGKGEGEDRALKAAEAAVANLLIEDGGNIKSARGLLISISGSDLTLFELDEAANLIREEVEEDADIMVGMALDETLNSQIRIVVVATGVASHNVCT